MRVLPSRPAVPSRSATCTEAPNATANWNQQPRPSQEPPEAQESAHTSSPRSAAQGDNETSHTESLGGTGAHAAATQHRLPHSSLGTGSGPRRNPGHGRQAAQEELRTAQGSGPVRRARSRTALTQTPHLAGLGSQHFTVHSLGSITFHNTDVPRKQRLQRLLGGAPRSASVCVPHTGERCFSCAA